MLYNMNKQHCKSSFSGHPVVKNLPANAGDTRDMGLIPGTERSPGVGNSNPLRYSCLENSVDRGALHAADILTVIFICLVEYLQIPSSFCVP